MKVRNQYFEILDRLNGKGILKKIEKCGRVCYKSENKISDGTAEKFVGNIIKRGHESVLEHVSFSVRFVTDRACYDDKTELLTEKGWVPFSDLKGDERVATLNDNNEVEYIMPTDIISYKYRGDMHHWLSTQVDLLVTPNHSMWLFDYDKRSDKNRQWKFIRSDEATNGRYKIKKNSNGITAKGYDTFTLPASSSKTGFAKDRVFPAETYNANDFFELLGWIVTDGCYHNGNGISGSCIEISQIKPTGIVLLETLLRRIGIPYKKYGCNYRLKSQPLTKWFKKNFIKHGDNKKSYYITMPRELVVNMNVNNIKSFLRGVIGGDGTRHTHGKGYQICTASKNFANDIMELSMLAGYACNVYTIQPRQRTFPNGNSVICKEYYIASIVVTGEHLIKRKQKNIEQYDGFVYCVELPKYHRLYVKRNGKAAWCGNCTHELVRHRLASFSQESQRYVAYDGDMEFIRQVDMDTVSEAAWCDCMEISEAAYKALRKTMKLSPQLARSVLPNSTKTEIIVTANLREWRHILKLRTSKAAHPQMRALMIPLLNKLKKLIPIVFDDIEVEK